MEIRSSISTRRLLAVAGLAGILGGALAACELRSKLDRPVGRGTPPSSAEQSTAESQPRTSKKRSREENTVPSVKNPARSTSLHSCFAALCSAQKKLRKMKGYSAMFVMQERVAGRLTARQRVALRVRHEPFSVRMKWLGDGREAVFVKGANDDQLLVKPTGLAAFVGVVALDPKGRTARKKSRYPITESGMLALVSKLIGYQQPLLKDAHGVRCRHSVEDCEGEVCVRFELTYDSPDVCDSYAKTILHVSQKSGLPVSIENYIFDENARSGRSLVEHYVYTDIRPHASFRESDFRLARAGLGGRLQSTLAARRNPD